MAYAANPGRFVDGVPKPARLPTAAWIIPPIEPPTNEKGLQKFIVLEAHKKRL